eukprot:scaffold105543_cov30-Tisochrysis_lutea.AAC.5
MSSASPIPPRCEPACLSSRARSVRTVRLPKRPTSSAVFQRTAAGIEAAAPRSISGLHPWTLTVQNSRAVGICLTSSIGPSTPHMPRATRLAGDGRRARLVDAAARTATPTPMSAARSHPHRLSTPPEPEDRTALLGIRSTRHERVAVWKRRGGEEKRRALTA